MDMIGGFIGLAIVVVAVQRYDERIIRAVFTARLCGYCPLHIHYDRQIHRWIHDNGSIEAPVERYPTQMHAAHPGGTLS